MLTDRFCAMTAATENFNRDHWQAQARQVARTVNVAWWLETLSAPLLVGAILTAAGLLVVRREFPQVEPWPLAATSGGMRLVLGVACWAWAGRRFEKPEQSLVRIEAAMLLRKSPHDDSVPFRGRRSHFTVKGSRRNSSTSVFMKEPI